MVRIFQPLEILHPFHRPVGGHQPVGAVLEGSHIVEPRPVIGRRQFLPEGPVPVEYPVDGFPVIGSKDHGQVEHRSLRHKSRHRSHLAHHQLDVVGPELPKQVFIPAQFRIGVVVDGHLSPGLLAHLLGHQFPEPLAHGAFAGGIPSHQHHFGQTGIGPGSLLFVFGRRLAAAGGGPQKEHHSQAGCGQFLPYSIHGCSILSYHNAGRKVESAGM